MAISVLMKEKTSSEQDTLIKQINLRKAKLSGAAKLSEIFAFFSLISTIDLNINEGDASPELIIAYVVNTSLLVTNTVLVKIATLWMTPRLDTAVSMSKFDLNELDQVPYESFMVFWDVIWVLASTVGFLLFGIEFILISWIKYRHYSQTIAICATAIMSPVLVCVAITATCSYTKLYKGRNEHKRGSESQV